MENQECIFKITGLTLAYGDRTILRDVNLDVMAGEFWFFLGPNGVGKTTLIKALLGMLPAQEGKILLNPSFTSRELIGFVPQRCDLNPTLSTTVSEFVLLGLAGLRTGKKETLERLCWALEKMNLEDMRLRNYWSLSGGQRQRALVARALVRRPKLLIADEATKDLDLSTTISLMQSLTDLNRNENLTVLFITHDLALAARFCTHTALFINGFVRTGSCQVVLNSEDLERAYGVPVWVHQDPTGALSVHIHGEGGPS
jgi:ABC-type cobalamin/Fe3+-siderophores transport system ATPase subunit